MGSNASTQRKPPVGGAQMRKSALKNSTFRRPQEIGQPYHMGDEPFETELYRPDREPVPETMATENTRTYPASVPDQPGARTVPRVHYEEDEGPMNRGVGERNDPARPIGRGNGLMNGRRWYSEDRFMDTNDDYIRRHYRSQVPYEYQYHPRIPIRRPNRPPIPYGYPNRPLPPQIYPIRPRRPRYVQPPPYNHMYQQPAPVVDERYRPAPIYHNSPRDVPRPIRPEQPPPYQDAQLESYRSLPQESYAMPPTENTITIQNGDQDGGLTDRSHVPIEDVNEENADDNERVVPSLLDTNKQQRPRSEESIHENDDDDEYIGANLRFYRNQIKFRPNGEKIDYIHRYWFGNYTLLENVHTYIQWLFPLYDSSRVNPDAVPLRAHEAKHICDDAETRHRFITSYLMMLDFYGFCMSDEDTGVIERSTLWKNRFDNLRRSPYNQTRITRILKSLGELGHSKLQSPFVIALFHEVFETKELSGIPPATIHHWLRAIIDDFERDYVFNQFKNGINRLQDERIKLKKKDDTKYYFEKRKPVMKKDEQFQFTTKKRPKH